MARFAAFLNATSDNNVTLGREGVREENVPKYLFKNER